MKIFAGTGHRPPKILINGVNAYKSSVLNKLVDFIQKHLEIHKPDKVISGMALGYDQALALAFLNFGISFEAYIPCENQDIKWPKDSKELYQKLLKQASRIKLINEQYTQSCMQERNVQMVNDCTHVLALYNNSKGGTKNCIDYAISQNKPIINLWQEFIKIN
jgi:uncharacterized phage-like protein YoqJ